MQQRRPHADGSDRRAEAAPACMEQEEQDDMQQLMARALRLRDSSSHAGASVRPDSQAAFNRAGLDDDLDMEYSLSDQRTHAASAEGGNGHADSAVGGLDGGAGARPSRDRTHDASTSLAHSPASPPARAAGPDAAVGGPVRSGGGDSRVRATPPPLAQEQEQRVWQKQKERPGQGQPVHLEQRQWQQHRHHHLHSGPGQSINPEQRRPWEQYAGAGQPVDPQGQARQHSQKQHSSGPGYPLRPGQQQEQERRQQQPRRQGQRSGSGSGWPVSIEQQWQRERQSDSRRPVSPELPFRRQQVPPQQQQQQVPSTEPTHNGWYEPQPPQRPHPQPSRKHRPRLFTSDPTCDHPQTPASSDRPWRPTPDEQPAPAPSPNPPTTRPGPNGPAITCLITARSRASDLLRVWRVHGHRFNGRHVAAMMNRVAKAPDTFRPDLAADIRAMLRDLDAGFAAHLPQYSAREVCLTIWAWGKLSHRPSKATWDQTMAALRLPDCTDATMAGAGERLSSGDATERALAVQADAQEQQRSQQDRWATHTDAGAGRGQGEAQAALPPLPPRAPQQQWQQQQLDPAPFEPSQLGLLADASPQALAMLAWGLHETACSDDGAWDALGAACRVHVAALQPRDLANVAWAHASAGRHSIPLFTDLARAVVPRAADLMPQDMANTVWAFATVGHPYRPLFDAVAAKALHILHSFTAQGLANTLWAFAAARVPAPQLFEAGAREARGRLHEFKPAHLAMMAWAFARGGSDGERQQRQQQRIRAAMVLPGIAGAMQVDLQAFKTKEMVLVLWSLAYMGHHSHPLFALVPAELAKRSDQGVLSWQDTSLTLWALAVAERYHAPTFAALSAACLADLPGFASCPRAVDTILLSLGMAGHYHPQLMSEVAAMLRTVRVSASAGRDARLDSMLLADESSGEDCHGALDPWAWLSDEALQSRSDGSGSSNVQERPVGQSDPPAGRGEAPHRRATGQRAGEGASALPSLLLRPAQAASVLASLARLNHRDAQACEAVAERLREALRHTPDEVSIPALANVMWAFAVMDHRDFDFLQVAVQHLATLEHVWPRQEEEGLLLSEEAMALGRPDVADGPARAEAGEAQWREGAAAGLEDDDGMDLGMWALRQVAAPWCGGVLCLREAMQLLQVALWLKDMSSPEADALLREMPQKLLSRAGAEWRMDVAERSTVSLLQTQVHAVMRDHMGLRPQMEVITPDGMFSIDIVVKWRGETVAVEVNGPTHYAQTDAGDPPAAAAPTLPPQAGGGGTDRQEGSHAGEAATAELQVPCVAVPRALGYKQLRDRFLHSRGYVVVNLSWLEWRAVQASPERASAYLGLLLDAAVASGGGRTRGRGRRRVERKKKLVAGKQA